MTEARSNDTCPQRQRGGANAALWIRLFLAKRGCLAAGALNSRHLSPSLWGFANRVCKPTRCPRFFGVGRDSPCLSPRHPRGICVRAVLLLAIVLATNKTHAADGPTLTTVEKPAQAAELESANATDARFQVAKDVVSIPKADIVAWGAPVEAERAQLALADGSLLVADLLAIRDEKITVVSPSLGAVELPLTQLSVYLLHPPTDPWRRDALLERLVTEKGETDRLVLDNGDELTGTLAASDGTTLQFESTIGGVANKIDVPVENIAAILFNPALRARERRSPSRTWIGLTEGSLVLASDWSVTAAHVALTRSDGAAWKSNAATGLAPLEFFQPLDGQARYLSDLEPEAYRHIPYLGREWNYRLDRTVSGARLRAGGKLYVKGIGMHSAARITFPIERGFQRFEAEIAIDDETQGGGSVVFRVFADSEEKYRSPIVRGGDPPLAISVPVAGASRLSLVVDHAERGDQLDRADWLNARLVP